MIKLVNVMSEHILKSTEQDLWAMERVLLTVERNVDHISQLDYGRCCTISRRETCKSYGQEYSSLTLDLKLGMAFTYCGGRVAAISARKLFCVDVAMGKTQCSNGCNTCTTLLRFIAMRVKRDGETITQIEQFVVPLHDQQASVDTAATTPTPLADANTAANNKSASCDALQKSSSKGDCVKSTTVGKTERMNMRQWIQFYGDDLYDDLPDGFYCKACSRTNHQQFCTRFIISSRVGSFAIPSRSQPAFPSFSTLNGESVRPFLHSPARKLARASHRRCVCFHTDIIAM